MNLHNLHVGARYSNVFCGKRSLPVLINCIASHSYTPTLHANINDTLRNVTRYVTTSSNVEKPRRVQRVTSL